MQTSRRIVVGVDGSPSGARALTWAVAEAQLRGVALEVVHVDFARHVTEMLVVGSRGLSGLKEMALGSVSSECAHHALCPVLIIRPDSTPVRIRT